VVYRRVVRDVRLIQAISVHHVDLVVEVPEGHEGDLGAVAGERRAEIVLRLVRLVLVVKAKGVIE
jgi:hypothetical protein